MKTTDAVSRRGFVGGVASAIGVLGARPGLHLPEERVSATARRSVRSADDLRRDGQAVRQRESVWAARLGDEGDDGRIWVRQPLWLPRRRNCRCDRGASRCEVGEHSPRCGIRRSSTYAGTAFLQGGKKVLRCRADVRLDVYSHATSIKADAIKLPLLSDFRQDIPAMIQAAKMYDREVGFVYLCNPNNPTGRIVTKQEVQQLLDGISTGYAPSSSTRHIIISSTIRRTRRRFRTILAGRPVIVTRTFSQDRRTRRHASRLPRWRRPN